MKEFKYELDEYDPYCIMAITPCPYFPSKTIGSIGCKNCKYIKALNKKTLIVVCAKDELEDK